MPEFRFLFTAQDYQRSVDFYTEALGLPVVASWDDHGRGTIVAAADGEIEIFGHDGPGAPPRVTGAAIAWQVADVDAEIVRLRRAGAAILEEPTDRSWGHRNAVISDPDGLRITLFTVTGGA
jgi:catechol 2,3-dioxygenase-like lactoylglutathione lyase family enzyme